MSEDNNLIITNELVKRLSFTDVNRLKFGAVVVDAGVGGNKYGNAHMKVNVQDGKKKTYDFDRYREMFGERMLKDDLYLGYYLHLVQDALYRNYVYDRYHWNPVLPRNVERLHKDYEIINQYVINKYGLMNDLIVPDRFEDEALNQISAFDTKGLMQDMSSYFLPVDEEPIFFFTKEMSDEFIEEAMEFCVDEFKVFYQSVMKPAYDAQYPDEMQSDSRAAVDIDLNGSEGVLKLVDFVRQWLGAN